MGLTETISNRIEKFEKLINTGTLLCIQICIQGNDFKFKTTIIIDLNKKYAPTSRCESHVSYPVIKLL